MKEKLTYLQIKAKRVATRQCPARIAKEILKAEIKGHGTVNQS